MKFASVIFLIFACLFAASLAFKIEPGFAFEAVSPFSDATRLSIKSFAGVIIGGENQDIGITIGASADYSSILNIDPADLEILVPFVDAAKALTAPLGDTFIFSAIINGIPIEEELNINFGIFKTSTQLTVDSSPEPFGGFSLSFTNDVTGAQPGSTSNLQIPNILLAFTPEDDHFTISALISTSAEIYLIDSATGVVWGTAAIIDYLTSWRSVIFEAICPIVTDINNLIPKITTQNSAIARIINQWVGEGSPLGALIAPFRLAIRAAVDLLDEYTDNLFNLRISLFKSLQSLIGISGLLADTLAVQTNALTSLIDELLIFKLGPFELSGDIGVEPGSDNMVDIKEALIGHFGDILEAVNDVLVFPIQGGTGIVEWLVGLLPNGPILGSYEAPTLPSWAPAWDQIGKVNTWTKVCDANISNKPVIDLNILVDHSASSFLNNIEDSTAAINPVTVISRLNHMIIQSGTNFSKYNLKRVVIRTTATSEAWNFSPADQANPPSDSVIVNALKAYRNGLPSSQNAVLTHLFTNVVGYKTYNDRVGGGAQGSSCSSWGVSYTSGLCPKGACLGNVY